jgi:predicted nucleic acid-binding Zn ribbon protein
VGNSRLGGSAAKGEETEVSLRMLERGQAVVRVIRERERNYILLFYTVSLLLLLLFTYILTVDFIE